MNYPTDSNSKQILFNEFFGPLKVNYGVAIILGIYLSFHVCRLEFVVHFFIKRGKIVLPDTLFVL